MLVIKSTRSFCSRPARIVASFSVLLAVTLIAFPGVSAQQPAESPKTAIKSDSRTSALPGNRKSPELVITPSSDLPTLNDRLKANPHHPLYLKMRAIALLRKGQMKEAISDLDEFVGECPNSYMAYACRTVARAADGDDFRALQDLTQYLYVKRNVSFHIQDSAERTDVENISHLGPIPPPALMISLSECDDLRKTFTQKLGASSATNHRAQALLLFFEHDYRKALTELNKVKALPINHSEAAIQSAYRSIFLRAISSFNESIKEARQAITLDPNQRVYYETLDCAYFAADRREDGLAELNKMDAKKPNNVALVLTIADIDSQLGNREKARTFLTYLLKSKPTLSDALLMRADLFKADLMNEKAYNDYRTVHIIDPKNPKAIEGMGFCCYELKRYDEALSYFQSLTAQRYDLKKVYAASSMCLAKKGQAVAAAKMRQESANYMY